MTDDEIVELSLVEVASAIAQAKLSSTTVTQACLARIERLDSKIRAIVSIDPAAALRDASRADDDLAAGQCRGPLHGVPLAHKDLFYRKSRTCTCGSRIRADFIPDHTATVLQNLDDAGALDIASLALAEFGIGSTLPVSPHNPWNLTHFPGESSSGPATAVAGRFVYGALGSDTGGSIRIPASCCGLVGMKPTYGRASRHGAMPLSFSTDHVGPLARTVSDCALLTSSISGYDPKDPASSRHPVPDYLANIEGSITGLRLAVPSNYFYDPVDPEIRNILNDSLDVYRSLGAEIVEVVIPRSLELVAGIFAIIVQVEGATLHRRWLTECPDDYGPHTFSMLAPGLNFPATTYIDALNLRANALLEFNAAVFEKADLLHAPAVPIPVPTIANSEFEDDDDFKAFWGVLSHCTRPFNALGLPALSIPGGFDSNKLPVGFQLVGRAFDEDLLFRAGRAYERKTSWTRMAPLLS